jgi:hypothetical protein
VWFITAYFKEIEEGVIDMKIIKIHNCSECPHFDDMIITTCKIDDRPVPMDKIPYWCKLEDFNGIDRVSQNKRSGKGLIDWLNKYL